jgi:hypothetical protein
MASVPQIADMAAFTAIQQELTEIQSQTEQALKEVEVQSNAAANALFEERSKLIAEHAPKNFWSLIILNNDDIREELLGSYDEEIFKAVKDFNVKFLDNGSVRIEMSFNTAENAYFTNEVLFAQRDVDEEMTFSGVDWKEGKGPLTDEEVDAQEERAAGSKAPRDVKGDEGRGDSFFETFFGQPPADPSMDMEEDEELDEEEEEELAAAEDDFEEAMREKNDIFECLTEEIWKQLGQQ